MPEVIGALDKCVDPKLEKSIAVHSIFGRRLVQLYTLDPNWIKTRLNLIFPTEKQNKIYRREAWTAYLLFSLPYQVLFDILRPYYKSQIEALNLKNDQLSEKERKLIEHIVAFAVSETKNKGSGVLLEMLFDTGNVGIQYYAISFMGDVLYGHRSKVSQEAMDKFKTVWLDRSRKYHLSNNITSVNVRELTAFGKWFASGMFDLAWSLEQLQTVLTLCKTIDDDHLVAEKLVESYTKYPEQVLDCIRLLAQTSSGVWSIYGWEREAKVILRDAMKTNSPELNAKAKHIINHLLARGYNQFEGLVT
jgi:hypothetical protein